jgi:hypothetical protein
MLRSLRRSTQMRDERRPYAYGAHALAPTPRERRGAAPPAHSLFVRLAMRSPVRSLRRSHAPLELAPVTRPALAPLSLSCMPTPGASRTWSGHILNPGTLRAAPTYP